LERVQRNQNLPKSLWDGIGTECNRMGYMRETPQRSRRITLFLHQTTAQQSMGIHGVISRRAGSDRFDHNLAPSSRRPRHCKSLAWFSSVDGRQNMLLPGRASKGGFFCLYQGGDGRRLLQQGGARHKTQELLPKNTTATKTPFASLFECFHYFHLHFTNRVLVKTCLYSHQRYM